MRIGALPQEPGARTAYRASNGFLSRVSFEGPSPCCYPRVVRAQCTNLGGQIRSRHGKGEIYPQRAGPRGPSAAGLAEMTCFAYASPNSKKRAPRYTYCNAAASQIKSSSLSSCRSNFLQTLTWRHVHEWTWRWTLQPFSRGALQLQRSHDV